MILGNFHIFIHIESNDVLEGNFSLLIELYQLFVRPDGR